jgi:hypothetical protein
MNGDDDLVMDDDISFKFGELIELLKAESYDYTGIIEDLEILKKKYARIKFLIIMRKDE